MAKIKVDVEKLKARELPYGNYDESGNVFFLEDTIYEQTRWSTHHKIIFEMDGRFWRAYYSEGSTEQQCEEPWEYDTMVELEEVHQVERLVKVWERV